MFEIGSWMYGGWLVVPLVWVVPIALLFLMLKKFAGNKPPTARELLYHAYARSDLSREEYLKKRADLAGR